MTASSESQGSSKYRTAPLDTEGFPPGIPYIVSNEAAERFSYYGMNGILFAFMTAHLADGLMSKEVASEWTHNFKASVYFFPIIGALLSDLLFGKYTIIIALSVVYCLGHGVLALMDFPDITGVAPRTALFWGLLLIAIGSGGIKPCVTAHVGDQFSSRNAGLLSKVYGWFYISINVGAMISLIITPWLLDHPDYGPGWAFGLPGVLMAIATFAFWCGRNSYAHIPPAGRKFWDELKSPAGQKAIARVIPVFILIMGFWVAFDQSSSRWIDQAQSMNRVVNLGFTQFEVLPSQMQAVNPALILILVPLFSYLIYPTIDRVWKTTLIRRITAGLFLTVPAFGLSAWLQGLIDAELAPHIGWQFLAYILLTSAEVLVSVTGYEFAYTQAPKTMKSFMTSLYLLSISFANFFVAQVNGYIDAQQQAGTPVLEGSTYYWFFTGVAAVTAVLSLIYMPFFKGQTILQDDVPPMSEGESLPHHPKTES